MLLKFVKLCKKKLMESSIEGMSLTVSLKDFFETWRKVPKKGRNRSVLKEFLRRIGRVITSKEETAIMNEIKRVSKLMERRWQQCGRVQALFNETNKLWLDGQAFHFSFPEVSEDMDSSTDKVSPGRPKVENLASASKKTKIRRVQDLLTSRSVEELTTAAEVAVRKSGQRDTADIMKNVCSSPSKGTRMKHSLNTTQTSSRCLTNEEALAYYVDSKSTVTSYKMTRKYSFRTGNEVFPSYYSVLKAKKDYYPSEEHITITETRAEIKMQGILDKTISRLIEGYMEVFLTNSLSEFTLISKWGGDGSSGHSNYKQKFSSEGQTDEYLFVFSFVPIRVCNHEDNNIIIWQNPRPGSTRHCRPIKFIFSKETTEFVKKESQIIREEINQLVPTVLTLSNGKIITVHHKLLLTMVDGKVCNILTETSSSQKCFICGSSANQMNNIAVTITPNVENYSFGLSTLHAWIRCFECFLHIAYKLEHKKWRLNENVYKSRKTEIQARFKSEMGLVVDKPKPGFGSSNDGNTARRSEKSAVITGLDPALLKRFDIILRVISSGYEIKMDELEIFVTETKTMYLNLYSWYNMPATVHKILNHATSIIKYHIIPIGQLSEEAQEARNKDCRRFREHNTRKTSRCNTNRDLLSMLLITSDPLINTFRTLPSKKPESLPTEVLALLSQPKVSDFSVNSIDLESTCSSFSDDTSEES